jgi:hypothetical protein
MEFKYERTGEKKDAIIITTDDNSAENSSDEITVRIQYDSRLEPSGVTSVYSYHLKNKGLRVVGACNPLQNWMEH